MIGTWHCVRCGGAKAFEHDLCCGVHASRLSTETRSYAAAGTRCVECSGDGLPCHVCGGGQDRSYASARPPAGAAGPDLMVYLAERRRDPWSAGMDPDYPAEELDRRITVEARQVTEELRSAGRLSTSTARRVGQQLTVNWHG